MIKYKFTQFGTFSVIIMVPVFIFSLIMIFTAGLKDVVQFSIFAFLAVTFLISLLIFYKLTIYVDDTHVTMRLGVGMISKKYPVTDIKSCRAVRNSPLYGIGIRIIPNGWLYNVSGLEAIELTFKSKKSVIRIGTDNPDMVSEVINRLINNDKYESYTPEKDFTGYSLAFILILVALILPVILIIYGSRNPDVTTAPESLTVKGMYGLTVNYSDILQIDTLPDLPGVKTRTNGFATGRTLKGNFTLRDGSKAKLFLTKEVTPCINIKTRDLNIFLNQKDPAGTRNLYKQIETELKGVKRK